MSNVISFCAAPGCQHYNHGMYTMIRQIFDVVMYLHNSQITDLEYANNEINVSSYEHEATVSAPIKSLIDGFRGEINGITCN
jgi:hypothetical protein